MCAPARRAGIKAARLIPKRKAGVGRNMPNGRTVQNHTGAGSHERIGMKLLVPECSHIGLIANNELIVIVKFAPKACANIVQREESHAAI